MTHTFSQGNAVIKIRFFKKERFFLMINKSMKIALYYNIYAERCIPIKKNMYFIYPLP